MTIDFEKDLRDDLHRATAPDLDVDVDDVIGRGHTAVTRRTMLRGALGLGVLAVGGLAAGIVSDRLPLTVSPAKQSPADWVTVEFGRLAKSSTGEYVLSDPKLIRVEVNRATLGQPNLTEANVRFRFSDDKGTFDDSSSGGDAPTSGVTWGTGADDDPYVVGLIAGRPESLTAFGVADNTFETRPVPGTNLTAFLMRFDDPAKKDTLDKIFWADKTGTIRNQFGLEPAQVAMTSPVALTAFVDTEQKVWGCLLDGDVLVAPDTGSTPLPLTQNSNGRQTTLVLLDKGSRDVRVDKAALWKVGQVTVAGRVFAVIHGQASAPRPTLLWRDADGRDQQMEL